MCHDGPSHDVQRDADGALSGLGETAEGTGVPRTVYALRLAFKPEFHAYLRQGLGQANRRDTQQWYTMQNLDQIEQAPEDSEIEWSGVESHAQSKTPSLRKSFVAEAKGINLRDIEAREQLETAREIFERELNASSAAALESDSDPPMHRSPCRLNADSTREKGTAKRVMINHRIADSSLERECSEGEIGWVPIRRRSTRRESKQTGGVRLTKGNADSQGLLGRHLVGDARDSRATPAVETVLPTGNATARPTQSAARASRPTISSILSAGPRSGLYATDAKERAIKLLKNWGLKFSGKDKSEDPEEFWDKFEECRDDTTIPDRGIISALPCILSKRAARWFRTVKTNLNSWDDLKTAFKAQFTKEFDREDLLEDLRQRTQAKGELVANFLMSMRYIVGHFADPPSEKSIVETAYRNLLPEYRRAMLDKVVENLEDIEI